MKKNIRDIAFEVIFNKWGTGEKRKKKLTKAGYNYSKVQSIVNDILKIKSVDTVAQEVIDGKWGSGKTRKKRLEKVGYNYNIIQNRVNEILEETKPITTKMCDWAKKIADSKAYHYKKWKGNDKRTQQCPICHNLTGEYKGWNCIGFAFACWKHGGGLNNTCSCSVIGNEGWEKMLTLSDKKVVEYAQSRTGLKDIEVIRNNGKAIPQTMLKKGDILAYYVDNDKYQHTLLYIGNGKISDCTSGCKTGVRYNKKMPKNIKLALRYTGK